MFDDILRGGAVFEDEKEEAAVDISGSMVKDVAQNTNANGWDTGQEPKYWDGPPPDTVWTTLTDTVWTV
jgi:hypothetical protein